MLTLGCNCRGIPPGGGCTGGGPLDLTGSPLSLLRSGEPPAAAPNDVWDAEDEGRALRFWLISFRGGVGACSATEVADGKADAAPSGPSRGSDEPSTASSRVD